jgi:hypothetical protein
VAKKGQNVSVTGLSTAVTLGGKWKKAFFPTDTRLGYAALIGRDVLSKCRFLYDGQGNRFRLLY